MEWIRTEILRYQSGTEWMQQRISAEELAARQRLAQNKQPTLSPGRIRGRCAILPLLSTDLVSAPTTTSAVACVSTVDWAL